MQNALIKNGYDLGPDGADGDCGLATVAAIRLFQSKQFGPGGIDLIVGATTAEALGLQWPVSVDDPLPAELAPIRDPTGPAGVRMAAAASSGPAIREAKPDYRSLTPGGTFSSTPFDLGQRRSLRSNNPGALNVSAWQRTFPGFVGETQPDAAGNRTAIYTTPEHGIAAWYHLMVHRYGIGEKGETTLESLAVRYAGVADKEAPAVKAYVKGWVHHSAALGQIGRLSLASDEHMVTLARGMFGHEYGAESPWKDGQVTTALALARAGKLPPK